MESTITYVIIADFGGEFLPLSLQSFISSASAYNNCWYYSLFWL